MKKILLVLGLLSLFISFSTPSFASHKFGIFGDTTMYKPTNVSGAKAKLNFGGGATMEFGLGPKIGLELGAFYLQNKYEATSAVLTKNVTAPLLLRIWFIPTISVGVGGYFSYGLGKVTVASTDFDYSAASLSQTDFGLMGALGFNFKVGPTVALVLEGRYAYGLKDIDTSATTSKSTNIIGMVGLRFGGTK
ncbi:MAG: PorT family protein [Deltaproteobacteria bacterium]|nr:PorT family protein [Deltaproteobacteria bacterium]